jgi:hypothetical protein
MGMYDYVDVSLPCIKCSHILDDFQTKDTERTLTTVPYWRTHTFYTDCNNCGYWNEYTLKKDATRPITDYEPVGNSVYNNSGGLDE